MRHNPWRYNAPPGWNNIADAPRDGTVIETQNNYGVAPTFHLRKWVAGSGWVDPADERSGTIDGPHLSWRPYAGAIDAYCDPTGGAQMTRNYWLLACGAAPVPNGDLPMDHPLAFADRDIPVKMPPQRKSWLARLFA